MLMCSQLAKVNAKMKLAVEGNATEELWAFGKEVELLRQSYVQ